MRPNVEALEALIEEARRRARRRRIRYGVMAALATGTIAALLAVDGGSGGSRAFALESPKPATNPAERALRTGGQLSVIGIPTSGRQQPTAKSDGWYGLSTVGRSGALRYLVRCPGQVRWCGWVESLDWSPNGRWLALSVTSISAPTPTTASTSSTSWRASTGSSRAAFRLSATGSTSTGRRIARASPTSPTTRSRSSGATAPVHVLFQRDCAAHGLRRPGRSTESASPSRTDRATWSLVGLRRGLGRSQSHPARSGSGGAGMVARRDDDRARLSLRWDQARDADRQGRHTGARPLPRHRRYGRPDLVAGREPDCGRESWVDVDVRASRDLRDGCRRQEHAAAHTGDRARCRRKIGRIVAAPTFVGVRLELEPQGTFPHTPACRRLVLRSARP